MYHGPRFTFRSGFGFSSTEAYAGVELNLDLERNMKRWRRAAGSGQRAAGAGS